MNKVKIYVTWERTHGNQLEEGSIPLEDTEVFEFDTQGEADAFILGIEKSNGWEYPNYVKDSDCKVEDGIVTVL